MKSLHTELNDVAQFHILKRYLYWRVVGEVYSKFYISTSAINSVADDLIEQIEDAI